MSCSSRPIRARSCCAASSACSSRSRSSSAARSASAEVSRRRERIGPADEPGADRDEQDRDVDVVRRSRRHGEPETGDERDEDRPADAPRQGHAQRDGLEITLALVVSDATAKTHVKRILAKLDLDNRVQAVVCATSAAPRDARRRLTRRRLRRALYLADGAGLGASGGALRPLPRPAHAEHRRAAARRSPRSRASPARASPAARRGRARAGSPRSAAARAAASTTDAASASGVPTSRSRPSSTRREISTGPSRSSSTSCRSGAASSSVAAGSSARPVGDRAGRRRRGAGRGRARAARAAAPPAAPGRGQRGRGLSVGRGHEALQGGDDVLAQLRRAAPGRHAPTSACGAVPFPFRACPLPFAAGLLGVPRGEVRAHRAGQHRVEVVQAHLLVRGVAPLPVDAGAHALLRAAGRSRSPRC